MTSLLKSLIFFAVVALLTACGGGGNPSDVTQDAADVVSADIQDMDTVQPDGVARDVTDVVADVPTDDVVGDVPVDVPAVDLIDDVVCVPDCSGGACTDDGCGGDCCDEGSVCDQGWPVSGVLCLPTSGTTCWDVRICLENCDTEACSISCYNSGSEVGRSLFMAIAACVDAACEPYDQGCLETAWQEGGPCFDKTLACMYDGCVSDCSGGECTDDGCGGDCCEEGKACEESLNGPGLACLPPDGSTCGDVVACVNNCATESCAIGCYNAGSSLAREAYRMTQSCLDVSCPTSEPNCLDQAGSPGGACYVEVTMCLNQCNQDCSGGPCTDDGCGGDCCAPEGVCETPEGGGADVCVPVVDGTTCIEIIQCINDCIDNECAGACANAGSAAAQTAFYALYDCLDDNCAGQGEECVTAAIASGGACNDVMNECQVN